MNRSTLALLTARLLAWTLLLGGWLVMGTLAQRLGPSGWAAFAPVAVWLLVIGLAAGTLGTMNASVLTLRVALMTSAALTAWAQASGGGAAPWLAALGGGALVALASATVRRLRGAAGRVGTPLLPASLAVLIVSVGSLDLGLGRLTFAVAVGGVGLLLAALLRSANAPSGRKACRSGLFDCALAWPSWAQWREPAQWPLAAAAVGMLPMMAALSLMPQWCSEGLGTAPWSAGLIAAHLGAMLAPAWLLLALAPRLRPRSSILATGLLGAAGVLALAWPGGWGLLLLMLCQAAAWGCVWAAALGLGAEPRWASPRSGVAASAGVAALAVLALGAAWADLGPGLWRATAVGLAGLALAGPAVSALQGKRGMWRASH